MRNLCCFFIAFCAMPVSVMACTMACTPNLHPTGPIIVKSFDWDNRDGLVFLNQKHLRKTAIGVAHPKVWTSRYFNVTFNQWGMNMPMGGMNEKGLVVEVMKVGDFHKKRSAAADYPNHKKQGKKKALNQLQWVQYILDTSSNLSNAVKNAKKVYAVPSFSIAGVKAFDIDPVHYQICEPSGKCRVFEYQKKKLLISRVHAWKGLNLKDFTYGKLPFGPDTMDPDKHTVDVPLVPVLANNYYETDANCLAKYAAKPKGTKCKDDSDCHKACGNIQGRVSSSAKSARRFIMAASHAQSPSGISKGKAARNYGFWTMAKNVCNSDTQWQIVYLPKWRHVYWRTIRGKKDPYKCKAAHKNHGYVNLNKQHANDNCRQMEAIKVYDLDGSVSGHPYKKISYPSLTYPTLTKINSQALYLNFRHSRFKTSKAGDSFRANALSAVEMTSQFCKY